MTFLIFLYHLLKGDTRILRFTSPLYTRPVTQHITVSSHGRAYGNVPLTSIQGCSLGLERLGLEAVSRRFLERLGLVSVLKVERLGLVSVLRVWKNRTSRSRGFVTLGLVNIHAMHQACGYISKKIMDLTRKKQVFK